MNNRARYWRGRVPYFSVLHAEEGSHITGKWREKGPHIAILWNGSEFVWNVSEFREGSHIAFYMHGKGPIFRIFSLKVFGGRRVPYRNIWREKGPISSIYHPKICRLLFQIERPKKPKILTSTDFHRTNGFWSEI